MLLSRNSKGSFLTPSFTKIFLVFGISIPIFPLIDFLSRVIEFLFFVMVATKVGRTYERVTTVAVNRTFLPVWLCVWTNYMSDMETHSFASFCLQ